MACCASLSNLFEQVTHFDIEGIANTPKHLYRNILFTGQYAPNGALRYIAYVGKLYVGVKFLLSYAAYVGAQLHQHILFFGHIQRLRYAGKQSRHIWRLYEKPRYLCKYMRTMKNQPLQRELLNFKTGSQRTIKLNHDYQQGAKKIRFVAVIMYGEIPAKSTFRLYASSGQYCWDSKEKVPQNKSQTIVFNYFIAKSPSVIIDEIIVGVSAPMVVLLMVHAE